MNKKLFSRGNISVQLFNMTRDATSGYKESMVRFEWIKRNPLASFSYDEFMNVSRELVELAKKHRRGKLETEILTFNSQADYSTALSLSGGQDDSTLNEILNRRISCSLEEFSPEVYEKSTNPTLFLRTPKWGGEDQRDFFMMTLSAPLSNTIVPRILFGGKSGESYLVSITSNRKKKLEFYGQCLKSELFEELVRKYHKPGLTHSLGHDYTLDNPWNFLLCKLPA